MDYTIHDLPDSEKPREKLRLNGASSLTDTELLAIILRTGTRGKNVKELASEILNRYSVRQLSNRSIDELKDFNGVSDVKAGQIVAAGELSRRMKREDKVKLEEFSDVKSAVKDMKSLETEILRVFYLNSGNEIVREEQFDGSVAKLNLNPQNIFKPAMESNATAVILAHNHPSGKAIPTEQDITTTRELIEVGRKLGIEVMDHVVVAEESTSMRRSTSAWGAH